MQTIVSIVVILIFHQMLNFWLVIIPKTVMVYNHDPIACRKNYHPLQRFEYYFVLFSVAA